MPVWVEFRKRAGFVRLEQGVRPTATVNNSGGHIAIVDGSDKVIAIFPADVVARAQNEDPAVTDKSKR
jgi:hypothetical protein